MSEANEQAWEDMRAYNIRLEERAREAERALAEMREALEWLASGNAWEVTPRYADDGRYRFNTTHESVYATPWGFARAALRPSEDTSDES